MNLNTKLRQFLLTEKASVRLINLLSFIGPRVNIAEPGSGALSIPKGHVITISQFMEQYPLERLRKEVFGFGKKAQAELCEIMSRHVSCRTGRRYGEYVASLRPKQPDRTCVYCGCTDSRACVGPDGPCHWAVIFQHGNAGICSHCGVQHAPVERLRPSASGAPGTAPASSEHPGRKRRTHLLPLTEAEKKVILEGRDILNQCKGCGCPVSPESEYCGECLCENDSP